MSDKPNTYEVDKCGLVLSREDIARENTYVAMQDYDELKAKLTAAQEDARRYRWLRERCDSMSFTPALTIAEVKGWGLDAWSGDNLSAAIDAALRSAEGGK